MFDRIRSAIATRAAEALPISLFIGALFALEAFGRSVVPLLRSSEPWYMVLLVPAGAFALGGAGTFTLIVLGAVSGASGRELHVKPWFAASVIGGVIAFFVTFMSFINTDADRGVWLGLGAAVGWTALVLVVSVILRFVRRARPIRSS
jgi:hypothetical protein